MDTEQQTPEKIPAQEKWFVLYDTGYNGPFSFEIVTYLFKTNQIGKNNLLWSNALTHWQKIENISTFDSLANCANSTLYKSAIDSKILLDIDSIFEVSNTEDVPFENALHAYLQEPATPTQLMMSEADSIQPAVFSELTLHLAPAPLLENQLKSFIKNFKNYGYILKVFVSFLIVAAALGWAGFQLIKPKFKDFSELSKTQNNNLRALTLEPLVSGQEKAAVKFKYQNENLLFFLVTNLKEGTRIQFNLEPVANTTAGVFHPQNWDLETRNFSAQAQILGPNPIKLPAGYYTISVSLKNSTIHQSQIFLGLVNQKEYLADLNTYHQALNRQARYEIAELKQMLLTLAQQKQLVDESLIKSLGGRDFLTYRNAPKKNLGWFDLQAQIKTMTEYWDLGPQSKLYYVSLYKNIVQLEKTISDFQNNFLLALKSNDPDQELESVGLKGEDINKDLVRLKSNLTYLENIIENPTPTN
ncbi:MAG: hypothetical protein H7Z71_07320 [Moraxellaceae bacterium]|nr:hypothetical protein [Pseudobdellovibrionaceae bacterium]